MPREAVLTEISTMPDLVRLAHEVALTGRTRVLHDHGVAIAVLSPARPRKRARRTMTAADREAVLASVGSWESIVDGEQLKRELDLARSDNRRPFEPLSD